MKCKIWVQIGPPGAGKTTFLSRQCAAAAQKYGHDKVLVASLTRSSAHEAARDIELPLQQFGTMHAFAYRALGSPVVAESKLDEWNAAYPEMLLSRQSGTPDDGFELPDEATWVDKAKMAYSKMRTMGQTQTLDQDVLSFKARWEDWKSQTGYIDFNDMIDLALSDIDCAPGEPAVLLGDEWQDCGFKENQLMLKWAQKAEHLVLTGDAAQALFGFRGTNPLLLQELWEQHDPTRQPLNPSYRLSQAVYQQAQAWMARFQQTRRVTYGSVPPAFAKARGRDPIGFVRHTNASFARQTPESISDLLGPYLEQGKTVMLQATCGYMLQPVIKALREAGLPFHNPWRQNHGGWNPLPQKRARGFTVVDRVLAFCRPLPEVWGAQARFWTAQEVKAWGGALPSEGVLKRGGVKALQGLPDTMDDKALARLFRDWFLPETLPYLTPRPSLTWYLDKVKGSPNLRDYVLQISQRFGVKKLREKPQIILGTTHSLKGSEADIVFVAPDISMEAFSQTRSHPEASEELRRVFYVALTRAREGLILCQPGRKPAVVW